MDEGHRTILLKNISSFREDMVKVVEVMEHLCMEDILDETMKEQILSIPTRGDRVGALHTLISKRGPNAFEAYYKALRDTHNHHLANILEPHIAVEKEMQRESATASGGTGQTSAWNHPKQTDQDEPDLQEDTCGADIGQNMTRAGEKGQTEIVKQFQEWMSLCPPALQAFLHGHGETVLLLLVAVANMKRSEEGWTNAMDSESRKEEAMDWMN